MQPEPDLNQSKRLRAWSKIDDLVTEIELLTHDEILANRIHNAVAELVRVCVDTRTAELKAATKWQTKSALITTMQSWLTSTL